MRHVTALLLNGLRDYGLEPSDWPAVRYAPMAGLDDVEVEAWTGQLGLEPTPAAYVGHMVHVFRLVWQVLRDDGTCWINLGDSFAANRGYQVTDTKHIDVGNSHGARVPTGLKPKDLIGIPWRVAFALQADGWWLRSEIIWHKPNPMPESVTDRPTRAHEQVFLLTKSPKYFYDHIAIQEKAIHAGARITLGEKSFSKGQANGAGVKPSGNGLASYYDVPPGRNRRTVWKIATQPSSLKHYAGWPSALVAPMIKAGTSERGCCPACLAPYERVVEKVKGEVASSKGSSFSSGKTAAHQLNRASEQERTASAKTIGWRATCDCEAGEPQPATVLDIFAGTGTTARVAQRLGRHAILIDRSGDYVKMQHESMAQQSLFP